MQRAEAASVEGVASRGVGVGRDVISSIVSTGDHARFFIGPYERLSDWYVPPRALFDALDLDRFSGREWLFESLDDFLTTNSRGYFVIEAKAGLGKTAFLARLVRDRGYVHHFVQPGARDVATALRNLTAQLILSAGLDDSAAEGLAPAAPRPDSFANLLLQVAKHRRDRPVVIVVDGLDEAETPYGSNPLELPRHLPDGIFVVVAHQPGVSVMTDAPRVVKEISADSDLNLYDVTRFLEVVAGHPIVVSGLAKGGSATATFVDTLRARSQGVWIYLRYVINEIEAGLRDPADVNLLPVGLWHYYAQWWRSWRDRHEETWDLVDLPLLATLAVLEEPVSIERLISLSQVHGPSGAAERRIQGDWSPFMQITGRDARLVSLYHSSLREFVSAPTDPTGLVHVESVFSEELTQAAARAHERIADYFLESWGGLRDGLPSLMASAATADTYGLRYVSRHLIESGRAHDLHALLSLEMRRSIPVGPVFENLFDVACEASGNHHAFLAAIADAWRAAEVTVEEELVRGGGAPSTGLHARYALVTSSIGTLSQQLTTPVLCALVDSASWTLERGLAYARRIPRPEHRCEALVQLGRRCRAGDAATVLGDAISAAQLIGHEMLRRDALVSLLPCDDATVLSRLLSAVTTISDSFRGSALAALSHHVEGDLARETLEVVKDLPSPYWRAKALAALALVVDESDYAEPLQQTTERVEQTMSGPARAAAIASVLPHLGTESADRVQTDALASARAIPEAFARARASLFLVSNAGDAERAEILAEVMNDVQSMANDRQRAYALAAAASHLDDSLMYSALACIREMRNESFASSALLAVTPYCSTDLVQDVLAVIDSFKNSDLRAVSACETLRILPDHQRSVVAEKYASEIDSIQAGPDRSRVLGAIARYVPRSAHTSLLAAAIDSDVSHEASSAVAAIAADLSSELLRAATERLPSLTPAARASAMPAIVNRLGGIDTADLLIPFRRIGDDGWQVAAVSALGPDLTAESLDAAWRRALSIQDEAERKDSIVSLANVLPEALLADALSAARQFSRPDQRADVLRRLAERLTGDEQRDVLRDCLEALEAPEAAIYARYELAELVPILPDCLLEHAIRVAVGLPAGEIGPAYGAIASRASTELRLQMMRRLDQLDDPTRIECLSACCAFVGEDQFRELAEDALALEDAEQRAAALKRLAQSAASDVRDELMSPWLEAVWSISLEGDRAYALSGMSGLMSEAMLADAVVRVLEFDDPGWMVEGIAHLLPGLPREEHTSLVNLSLQAVRSMGLERGKATAMISLAAYLDDQDVLDVAAEIQMWHDSYWKGMVIASLIPFMKEDDLPNCVRAIAGLEADLSLVNVLEALEERMPCRDTTALTSELDQLLRRISVQRTRADVLRVISFAPSLITTVGGHNAAQTTADAIADVARWWP